MRHNPDPLCVAVPGMHLQTLLRRCMPLTCEEGKDPSLERPLIDMPLCAEHQERAPGVLRGQGGRHSRARGLHSQAWARGNGTSSSASANILPYITSCIGATCKRVAASFGPEAVLLVQPGAVEVFLDFISYSGGPLPEELLPQTTCPVSILWGRGRPLGAHSAGARLCRLRLRRGIHSPARCLTPSQTTIHACRCLLLTFQYMLAKASLASKRDC